MSEFNEKQQRKILRRYRWTLMFKIVQGVIALLFIYWVYRMGISIYYDRSDVAKQHLFNVSVAYDWTHPGEFIEMNMIPDKQINVFGTQTIEGKIMRRIGGQDEGIGKLTIEKKIFNTQSNYQNEYFLPKYQSNFHFYLPENPGTKETLSAPNSDKAWEKLTNLPEGLVADLGFSLDQYYDPKKIMEILSDYHVTVTWIPIYMGENDSFTAGFSSSSGNNMSVDTYGISSMRHMNKNGGSYVRLDSGFVDEIEANMLNQMETFSKKDNEYVEWFLRLRNLNERVNYLKENGFKGYGAVVTGKVSDLQKLKTIKGIRGVQVGMLDYWNY